MPPNLRSEPVPRLLRWDGPVGSHMLLMLLHQPSVARSNDVLVLVVMLTVPQAKTQKINPEATKVHD